MFVLFLTGLGEDAREDADGIAIAVARVNRIIEGTISSHADLIRSIVFSVVSQ